jgi:hypothetical protein
MNPDIVADLQLLILSTWREVIETPLTPVFGSGTARISDLNS